MNFLRNLAIAYYKYYYCVTKLISSTDILIQNVFKNQIEVDNRLIRSVNKVFATIFITSLFTSSFFN